MQPSYTEIDYRLRPAKNIERKMMCEAFRRLLAFDDLDCYRYIGLGSLYFADFVLFHRSLGIESMVSIEARVEDKVRFDFNNPFECIKVVMGHSNKVLPSVNVGQQKSIIWLDYDSELTTSVLQDVDCVMMEAQPGSVLVITVDAESKRLEEPLSFDKDELEMEWPVDPVEQLRRLVGERNMPHDLEKGELRGVGVRGVYYRILTASMEDALAARNARPGSKEKVLIRQIFHFSYADGAEMLTLGWMIFAEEQKDRMAKCDFEHVEFCRDGAEPYRIGSPKLTYREMRHLDRQLPAVRVSDLDVPCCIPKEDIGAYMRTYRWFPSFAEADL